MTWFEVLVEGASDVPALRSVLTRRFGLEENNDFRIHPHKGRGKLPSNLLSPPNPKHQGLLDQLPSKLKGFSYLPISTCVLVVVDVDNEPCRDLLAQLNTMLERLPKRPHRVLFRLAIEETESWFIADVAAVRHAYPRARTQKLTRITPDDIVGAWEKLAEAMGKETSGVSGVDKYEWAELISPHLNLDEPYSPSLRKLIEGIEGELARDNN